MDLKMFLLDYLVVDLLVEYFLLLPLLVHLLDLLFFLHRHLNHQLRLN
tara:strand:+ start:300 stop:443 length:144 start_codon:yes stop_codon:yes gene_type:complete